MTTSLKARPVHLQNGRGQYLRRILAIGKFLRIAENASYLIIAGTAMGGTSGGQPAIHSERRVFKPHFSRRLQLN
jgi:hypothetical protein